MAINLPAAVLAFITSLEHLSGVPIAMLDRVDDPQAFWARSAAILCQKTGDDFCDDDMRFMTSNTEPMGQSQIIEYTVGDSGQPKRVCAIIPPIPNIDPSFVADAYGQPYPSLDDVPAAQEAAAWLTLYHAAHCLDQTLAANEEDRAVALASLGLTLLEGNPMFTPGYHRSPGRMMAVMTGRADAYWAAGTGERILLDLWKDEAAERLNTQFGCYAIVEQNKSIDIENIHRATYLGPEQTCQTPVTGHNVGSQVTVSDSNLWLWMYGQNGQGGGIGAPPAVYEPMKPFKSMDDGVAYVLQVSNELAAK